MEWKTYFVNQIFGGCTFPDKLKLADVSPIFKVNDLRYIRGEWPSGLYSLRQVTKVKLGRVRSNSGWVTSEV